MKKIVFHDVTVKWCIELFKSGPVIFYCVPYIVSTAKKDAQLLYSHFRQSVSLHHHCQVCVNIATNCWSLSMNKDGKMIIV
jgi:hypothetical protein